MVVPQPVLKELGKEPQEQIHLQVLSIKRAAGADRKEGKEMFDDFYLMGYINANSTVVIPKDHAENKDILPGDELVIDFLG